MLNTKSKIGLSFLLGFILFFALKTNIIYASGDTWIQVEPDPDQYTGSFSANSLFKVNDDIFCYTRNNSYLGNIRKYNIHKNKWERIPKPLNFSDVSNTLAVVGNDIYNLPRDRFTLLKYNTIDQTWSKIDASVPNDILQKNGTLGEWEIMGTSSAVHNNKIYFIGGDGHAHGENAQVCFVYDPSLNTWKRLANYNDYYYAENSYTLVKNNKIYVLSGFGTKNSVNSPGLSKHDAFFCYDIATNKWTQLKSFYGYDLFEYNNNIYSFDSYGSIYQYNIDTNTWSKTTDNLNYTTKAESLAQVSNNKLFMYNENKEFQYYGKNTDIKHSIIYNSNGGQGTVPSDTFTYYKGNIAIIKSKGNLSRTGYEFIGWNTKKDGTGITYAENDSVTISGSLELYALWKFNPVPEQIILSPTTKTINVNSNFILTAIITPSEVIDKTITWSSSNPSVASVSSNGTVTGLTKGTATINGVTVNGKSASCIVTVVQPVTGVTISNSSMDLLVNETKSLSATVYPSNASNTQVTWSSSNSSIVTVTNNGQVRGINKGQAIITVTTNSGGYTARCTINVESPVQPESVSLDYSNLDIKTSESFTLVATVHPSNATNQSITWSSSNTFIVDVDSNGKITCKNPGNARIIAMTSNDKSAFCEVNVLEPVTGITISDTIANIQVEDEKQLHIEVNPHNASDKRINWFSNNVNIATVDINGLVKGIAEGETIITASSVDGNYTASCTVTVSKKEDSPDISTITITPTSHTMKVNDNFQIYAKISPETSTDNIIKWKSNNPEVLTVYKGKVTAKSAGTAIVTAYTDTSGLEATCEITVIVPVTGLLLSPTEHKMDKGDTFQLVTQLIPSNATNKMVKWFSSNHEVATINQSGIVTAHGLGKSTITAFTEDGGYQAFCQITVTDSSQEIKVEGVSISHEVLSLNTNAQFQLNATVFPSSATNKAVKWSSSNPEVLTVYKGKITVKSEGVATVTVMTEDGEYKATCNVTVGNINSNIPIELTLSSMNMDDLLTFFYPKAFII